MLVVACRLCILEVEPVVRSLTIELIRSLLTDSNIQQRLQTFASIKLNKPNLRWWSDTAKRIITQ